MAALGAALRQKRQARKDFGLYPTIVSEVPAGVAAAHPTFRQWLADRDEVRRLSRSSCDRRQQGDHLQPWRPGVDQAVRLSHSSPLKAALIDGEVCAVDAKGRSDFTLLKNSLEGKKPIVFFAFDLLEQDGEDIASLPRLREAPARGTTLWQPKVRGGSRPELAARLRYAAGEPSSGTKRRTKSAPAGELPAGAEVV